MLKKLLILSLTFFTPDYIQADYDFKSYATIAAGITVGIKLGNIAFNAAEKKVSHLTSYLQQPKEKSSLSQLEELFDRSYQTTIYQPKDISESLENVIGLDDAKSIFNSILLQTRQNNLGGTLPSSMILSGPSGIGKTMLVKAFAQQTNCTLIKTTVANLVTVISKNKVKEFVRNLKKCAPAILLVEDLSSVSLQTGTLINELIEVISFEQSNKAPLFFIGTTQDEPCCLQNSLNLDRFNYITQLWYPHINDRISLLGMYLKQIKHDATINIKEFAKQTFWLTGYDIKELINQAVTIATTKKLSAITIQELHEARNNMLLGSSNKSYLQSDHQKLQVAYHEAGHALVSILLPNDQMTFNLITIIPRINSLGLVQQLCLKTYKSKENITHWINICLGGKAAEELVFNMISAGPVSDLSYATNAAQEMICKYGMTDILGHQVLNKAYELYSQKTLEKIDDAITQMLDKQYEIVMNLLKENRDKLDKLAHAVYEKETMYADEVYELLEITPPNHKGKIFW